MFHSEVYISSLSVSFLLNSDTSLGLICTITSKMHLALYCVWVCVVLGYDMCLCASEMGSFISTVRADTVILDQLQGRR